MPQFQADKSRNWARLSSLKAYIKPSHLAMALVLAMPNIGLAETRNLHLEVLMNDQPTKLIGKFKQDDDGKILIEGKELNDIGLKLPKDAKLTDEIALDSLAGVSYRYDMPTQSLHIAATDDARLVKDYIPNMMSDEKEKITRVRHFGSLVNYSLFSSASKDFQGSNMSFSGVSGTFDTRVFGPLGALSSTTMIGNATTIQRSNAVRLDTTWTYSDPESLSVAKAGDLISGGHIWNRPVRLGGVQIARNFGLRPDLIAQSMPGVSGSAAVPSVVDVFVNNTRTYSQDVAAGPFRISNLPVLGNNGTARVVIREPNGRTTETTQSFMINANILAKGMFDYTAEMGYTRHEFGVKSNSYSNKLAMSASSRYGLLENLTLENHVEGTAKLVNAGAGFVTSIMHKHLLTMAGSMSQFEGKTGGQLFASIETHYNKMWFSASTQRTFGNYQDLASVTAKPITIQEIDPFNPFVTPGTSSLTATYNAINQSLLPPKAIDRLTVGTPLGFANASLSTSYVHVVTAEKLRSHIINATLNMSVGKNSTAFFTAFADRGDKRNYGLFAGFIMPFGKDNHSSLSVGASSDNNGSYLTTDITRPVAPEGDSWGYRLRDVEGKQSFRAASLMYRGKYAYGELTASQQKNGVNATAYLEGAVAMAGGEVFMSNRINDSFAVVKTSAPNVEVFYENRLMGKSGKSGSILIPNLRSNENNRVTINPNNLPLTASIDTTKTIAIPADKGVSIVDFGVIEDPKAAIVVFKAKDGTAIPVGSNGTLSGGENFVVGFDGKAYIKGLAANNQATIRFGSQNCQSEFDYVKNGEKMTVIKNVICQ